MKKLLLALAILLCSSSAQAAVFYVRPADGGTDVQCTGLTNAAYVSGTAQPCAFSHPNYATGGGAFTPTATKLVGGDTVVIAGPDNSGGGTGQYLFGYTMPNTGGCSTSWTYACSPNPPPSGSSGAFTKIIGCSTSGCGSNRRPQIYLVGRLDNLFNVTGKSYVEFDDLEITDHAALGYNECGDGASSVCGRTAFFGNGGGWHDLTFRNIWIHGLAKYAFDLGGQIGGTDQNLIMENVVIDKNAFGGFNQDTCNNTGTCGYHGPISFSKVQITYSGCVENYPVTGNGLLALGCKEQTAGGYGDGFGASNTGGVWTITDSNVSHNTSDGLDLLYFDATTYGTSSVTIKRSIFEGNNGQQVKTDSRLLLEDSMIIGDCAYFYGQPFTTNQGFNYCRASGNPLLITYTSDTVPEIYNTTITSNGDVMLNVGDASHCTSGTLFKVKNSIFVGGREAHDDSSGMCPSGCGNENTGFFYVNNSANCNPTLSEDYNLCYGGFSGTSCTGAHDISATISPFLGTIKQGPASSPGYFTAANYVDQLYLAAGSQPIQAGNSSFGDSNDLNSNGQTSPYTMGAVIYGSVPGSPPPSVCGNGAVEGSELCDGAALNSQTCVTQGYASGNLTCTGLCTFDTSGCVSAVVCGNNIKESGETCDGTDLNSQTCASQGYSSGTLSCASNCLSFTTSGCISGSVVSKNFLGQFTIGGKAVIQ